MGDEDSYLQLGKFYPPNWGGIETVTYNLEEALTEKGLKNVVIAFGNKSLNGLAPNFSADNIIRCAYRTLLGAPFSLSYLKIFRKIAKDYAYVIVHFPNPWAIICLFFGSSYSGKIILYWHSDIVNKGILGLLIRPFELWAIKKASVIIAPTIAHIDSSKYVDFLKNKCKIVPYPIGKSIYSIADSNQQKTISPALSAGSVDIIAIGRLVEYKGFEILIKAFLLLPKYINFSFLIIGDGPLKCSLNKLINSMGLENSIQIRSSVKDDELHNLLDKADIFCFPSNTRAEMYGMVQYEAMAHGLPIIATNIPGSGVPHLTSNSGAGLLVKPNSPHELAEAINKLINDQVLYSKLSRSGLESIRHKFNPAILINDFCDALR